MTARPHNLKPSRSPATGHSPLATRPARRGFTLTEVLIAMALVAVLLVGLGRIFQITSDTIKTGQAYQAALRKQKAVYTAISKDFLGYASNGNIGESDNGSGMLPISKQFAIVIGMNRVATHVNRAAASANGDPILQDAPGGNNDQTGRSTTVRTTSSGLAGVYLTGERNFRVDTIGFGAAGDFQRQTGTVRTGQTEYVSPMRSNEAFVWWGHGRVYNGLGSPDSLASYASPGHRAAIDGNTTGLNKNHAFAEEFILARMALLMREPAYLTSGAVMYGDDGNPQSFIARPWRLTTDGIQQGAIGNNANVQATANNAPFSASGPVAGGTGPASMGRVDVAAVSASVMRARLVEVLKAQTVGNIADRRDGWWYEFFTTYGIWGSSATAYYRDGRPAVNPFPTRPLTTEASSQRAMVVGDGCSQFIVEFAGDFFVQAANGAVTAVGPDGVIDFSFVNNRRITRWYGLPRDVDPDAGNGIQGRNGSTPPPVSSVDVVPVRDWAPSAALVPSWPQGRPAQPSITYPDASQSTGGTPRAYSFEKVVPPLPANGNYYNHTTSLGRQDDGYGYVVAWGPEEFTAPDRIAGVVSADPTVRGGVVNGKKIAPVPQLIRVIVEMRDPAGALGTPVTQEYVFPVPQD